MINLPSSLALKNGSIYTVDQDHSWAETIVIRGGMIEYVGPNEGAGPHINSNTQIIDLKGKMVDFKILVLL